MDNLVKSVVIICEDSPIGKNSTTESIRLGAGLMVLGDIESCKIIFMGDSVYFLTKKFNPEFLNMESMDSIYRMLELSDIEIFVLDSALNGAGITKEELIDLKVVKVASIKEISNFISQADTTFRY
ncbi:MAG: DsrE family protein [Candidatus Thorarchaeota archaeon]